MNKCPVCGKTIQNHKNLYIFYDVHPQARNQSVAFLEATYIQNEEDLLQYTIICDNHECLISYIKMLDKDKEKTKGLKTTNQIPGRWFQPSGCSHYLKDIYKEHLLDWYMYSYHWEEKEYNDKQIIDAIIQTSSETEFRNPLISVYGGYGNILEAWHHYCSIECALRILEKDDKNIIEEYM